LIVTVIDAVAVATKKPPSEVLNSKRLTTAAVKRGGGHGIRTHNPLLGI